MGSLCLGQSTLGSAVGKGLFANKDFGKGEKIVEFGGRLMETSERPKIITPQDDRYVQVGKGKHLGPSGKFDDFVNHSCNPNTGAKFRNSRVILVAIRKIRKGEEITWDYSTTMADDDWEMECLCGSKNCRKRIGEFKYLPRAAQQKYIRLGIVPKYVIECMKRS